MDFSVILWGISSAYYKCLTLLSIIIIISQSYELNMRKNSKYVVWSYRRLKYGFRSIYDIKPVWDQEKTYDKIALSFLKRSLRIISYECCIRVLKDRRKRKPLEVCISISMLAVFCFAELSMHKKLPWLRWNRL